MDQKEKERIRRLKERNIHPFFALIKPPDKQGPVFFRLGDGSRNMYFGKMMLKDGFAFSIGKDCTLVVEQVRQSVLLKEDERYDYNIDLAYIVSFGNEINRENALSFLKDTISYSFEIWRKSVGTTPN